MKNTLFILFSFSWIITFAQDYNRVEPDTSLWFENSYDTLILDSLKIKSIELNKPMPFYFYGNRNVNSFNFNERVLENKEITDFIQEHFFSVLFDIDSRKRIREERNQFFNGIKKSFIRANGIVNLSK